MTSIGICFLTDLKPGEELQIAPSSSSSALSSSDLLPGNQFSALVSNIFFLEKAQQAVDNSTNEENQRHAGSDAKEGAKEKQGDGSAQTAKSRIRVSLLASVLHKKESVPRVMTLASAIFCSEDEKQQQLRAAQASPAERSSRKRERTDGPTHSREGEEEEVVVSFPLRRPLLFRNYRPAYPDPSRPKFAGLMVHHLHTTVDRVDSETGEPQGRYRGSRQFAVRLSGLQETTLTAQQVELLQGQQKPPQKAHKAASSTAAHKQKAQKRS